MNTNTMDNSDADYLISIFLDRIIPVLVPQNLITAKNVREINIVKNVWSLLCKQYNEYLKKYSNKWKDELNICINTLVDRLREDKELYKMACDAFYKCASNLSFDVFL